MRTFFSKGATVCRYQAVEAYLQLTQQAGENQIDCDVGVIQCIGGTAATVITHIMEV
jgi:ribonuclease PH